MRAPVLLSPLAALILTVSGCGSSAQARLQFANLAAPTPSSSSKAAVLADGTSLRIKMLSVSITEDVDPVTQDNIGVTSNIWINPECGGDNDTCNIDGMDGGPSGPRVTQFFDFARPTADVNAELNSQDAKVTPGTYRYARVTFCKALGGQQLPTKPTLMWKAAGMPGELAFTSGDCGRTSLPFSPPLEIKAGHSVEVVLGYDLTQAIVVGTPEPDNLSALVGHSDPNGQAHGYRACFDLSASARACMDFPDFSPSASAGD
jgi:hypothetical protein